MVTRNRIDGSASSTPNVRPRQTPPLQKMPTSTAPVSSAAKSGYGVTSAAGTYTPFGAPAPVPASTAPQQSFGGADLGGGESFMDSSMGAPMQSDDEYLAGDGGYQLQLAALMKAAEAYDADAVNQRTKYDVDYTSSLKNLGYGRDNPETLDVNEGGFDRTDQNTASGRAFQNQQNDFAGRGMLQSSLYGQANDNLQRSLLDQLGSIDTGRENFMNDLSGSQVGYRAENGQAQSAARYEALQRAGRNIAI